MLSEYLQARPLGQMISLTGSIFPPAADRAAWENLPDAQKQEARELAVYYRQQPYPMRRATDFLAFVRDGSRKADENPYFFRRRKLCAAVLGYCVEPNQADLDEVIDGLWCICEESSWVISAHNEAPRPGGGHEPLPDVEHPVIDLFAAQTAMILSLSCALLGDALPSAMFKRAEREVRLRVLEPFMARDDFWWMGVTRKDLNNWTPWILSNVMITAECWLRDKERMAQLMERSCIMLDRWLACVPEDGGCDEGAGYWNMAGGALLDCLEVLERLTAGRMSLWQDEKLQRVLSFPARAQVHGRWFINFADCDARPFLSGERLERAGEKIGHAGMMALGQAMRGTLADELNDTPHFSRLLYKLFHPMAAVQAVPAWEDTWLPDLQVRMVRRAGMALCAKGGHNDESHNHNDVGSFMLYVDGEPQLVDAGNMIYTAKTFSGERYSLWNVRGAYHNVPIIGGQEQQPGRQYAARNVRCLPDGLALDMAAAYDHVGKCCRTLRLTEDGLVLQDDIELTDPAEVTWVFMLRHPPRIDGASLTAGDICMCFNSDLTAGVEEIPITDGRMARNFPGSLWRMTLKERAMRCHKRTFVIGRGA